MGGLMREVLEKEGLKCSAKLRVTLAEAEQTEEPFARGYFLQVASSFGIS
jgi:hypothetical protein